MLEDAVVQLAGIGVLAVGLTWLANRIKVPSILILLVAGFLLGPVLDVVDPDALLGDLLAPLVSVAVGLILFEGGLSLRLREVEGTLRVIWLLVSVGAALTWGIGALAAALFTDLSPGLTVLLGSILVVSGPTVVGPLLTHVRPSRSVSSILKWESIFIDPIGALIAVVTFDALLLRAGDANLAGVAADMALFLLTGSAVGAVTAVGTIFALRRHLVPEHLLSAVGLASALLAFLVADVLVAEAGLLATTILGLILANHRQVKTEQIVQFSEVVRVLLIGVLFLLLSSRLPADQLRLIGPGALGLVAALVLVARPLVAAISTMRSPLSWQERVFIGAVAPRGIVAASIASVFALELQESGVAGAEELTPLVFVVIVGTVALYGLGAAPLARRLGLSKRHQEGTLIIGAGEVEREIAAAIAEAGFPVLLATTNRRDEYVARMAGLPTYYGNVLENDVDLQLDLSEMGRMLALTPNDDVNTLAVSHFARIFGGANTYQLPPGELPTGIVSSPVASLGGRLLFGEPWDYRALHALIRRGGQVRRIQLSDTFGPDELRDRYGDAAVPLAIVRAGSRLAVVTAPDSNPLRGAATGDSVLALVREPA